MLARCCDCGAPFERAADEQWKLRCFPCWRKSKRPETAPPAPPPAGLDPARIRQLLQLVHPDKHACSALATEITQWLLGLRKGAR